MGMEGPHCSETVFSLCRISEAPAEVHIPCMLGGALRNVDLGTVGMSVRSVVIDPTRSGGTETSRL